MSAEIGIGTRVYIKWAPPEQDISLSCRTGVVIDGPFGPGFARDADGKVHNLKRAFWNVRCDDGAGGGVSERLLIPIDDGDPETIQDEEKEPATA